MISKESEAVIKVGIVGGTGYTGVELLRALANHPGASAEVITSRAEAGLRVDSLYPSLRGHCDLSFTEPDVTALAACDVVFFATPHAVAMNMMAELMANQVRVIDLSADFRLKDVAVWEHWYHTKHSCPELLAEAVYGLPEYNREQLKTARLVAVAGCYPTAVQLGYMPLLEQGLVATDSLIASAVSGVSGAGRQAKVDNLFAEVNDSLKAYGVAGHRHLPEIEQGLTAISGSDVELTFVPHLAPMTRGIHATLYADCVKDISLDALQSLYEERFCDEPFVDVLPLGDFPQTRSVKGANLCRIAVAKPQDRKRIVVMAVIDNLVKGASGQAVQIMNIMFDQDEMSGLTALALMP